MLAWRSESRLSVDGVAKRVGSADALIGALTGYDDLLQVLERFKKIEPPVVFTALDHRLIAFILPGYETKDAKPLRSCPHPKKHGIYLEEGVRTVRPKNARLRNELKFHLTIGGGKCVPEPPFGITFWFGLAIVPGFGRISCLCR